MNHVILVTYGEPTRAAFRDQLVYSWRILLGLTRTIAPIPKVLLPMIAVSRGQLRTRLWNAERYTSPLEPITAAQAGALERALAAADPAARWRVQVAYEFRRPLLAGALAAIPAGERVIVVPMYAAESDFTHALSRGTIAATAHARALAAAPRVLPALAPADLADVAAAHITTLVAAQAGWSGDQVALVLAAHGTLLAPSRPIDTGREATEALAEAIRARLAARFGLIVNGWLNHTRGGRWTEPAMDDALQQVVDAGFRRAVYFPYGFLADNAETELEGRIALRKQPGLEALHLPCLNDSPGLMDALASAILAESRRSGALPRAS